MSTKQNRESGSTSVKKEEKKAKVESASTHVTLRFKGQDEEEIRVFRMRRNVEMRKVMKRYGETRGVKWTTFVFILKDGTRIRESHTPDERSKNMAAETESDVVEVNRGLLKELEDMGFSVARAAWALHHSGNSSLEAAVNWIVDHENDSQFEKMPVVEFNIEIESPSPYDDVTAETAQARANELKERARKLREEEETKREREREKERIRAGKEMMEAKRIAEENERKRNIALRKAEKDEEKKAREKVMMKVNSDKAKRKSRHGLPTEAESTSTSTLVAPLDTKRILMPSPSPVSKAEEMRECLRSLRRNHKEEDPRTMRRAFETLLMIVRNAAKNPDEEKYRRIRVTNRLFQERVGRFKEGMEFMELCGFKREGGSEFLSLANDEGDMSRLRDAAFQLQSAVTNPFFGLLSKEAAEE
ncbi:hypothetical protein IGI04_024611 [Brassica rapa subsp. trilocularis]|uniref:UBA domain-containing protein n=1 Tax=Brassica rapa subsp. trilocularis TaxID=1813537 RepID=A0ABQ7M992_BRACM|nr:hypothetical protein IGI04_024611 [Brassica rapa subsp. trilocularis]